MDRLSNLLISIKNGNSAGKSSIEVPYSNFLHAIARALHTAGYIAAFEKKTRTKGGPVLFVGLRYVDQDRTAPRVHGVQRISKSSRRVYKGAHDMHDVRQNSGHVFVTSPKGILTTTEARSAHVGGEVLFEIW